MNNLKLIISLLFLMLSKPFLAQSDSIFIGLDYPPPWIKEPPRRIYKHLSKNEQWTIDLFPNPNYGNFAIISKPEKEKLEVKITDVQGSIVYYKRIETNNNIYTLDLSLTNGMYLVTIKNEMGQSLTKKMAVNR
jgi:hypothetical protein